MQSNHKKRRHNMAHAHVARCTAEHVTHPRVSTVITRPGGVHNHHDNHHRSQAPRQRRRGEGESDSSAKCRKSRQCHTPANHPSLWIVVVLYFLILITSTATPVSARHYIAPGACTWTHVSQASSPSSSSSRDTRYKSFSSSSSSPSSPSASSQVSGAGSLDVAVRCLVPVLQTYTLNTSSIEPEWTVQLSIVCLAGASSAEGAPSSSMSAASLSSLRHEPGGLAPFEHLSALTSLEMDNCKLDGLPSEAFRGLVSLRNLTIRNAQLSWQSPLRIEAHSFQHVSAQVEHLDLSYNHMQSLPNALFCPFVHLKLLNLSHNNLVDVSSFGIVHTAGLPCLHTVTHMDLSHNKLDAMPESVGLATLKHLRMLNLSSNHISEIGDLAFQTLNHIEIADLSDNRIAKLPDKMIRTCTEIRQLHLGKNALTALPGAFFAGLSKLMVIDLSGNQLTSSIFVPDIFIDQIRLLVLDLSHNRFRTLPANTFVSLYSLQVLSLEANHLETIEDGAFSTLYNLHSLKLGANRFHQISHLTLTGLFVLSELSLTNNQIEAISEDAFTNCTNLKEIDLSWNRLTSFPRAFRSLRSLRRINYSHNKLVSLTSASSSLSHLSDLSHLDVSDNYLTNITRAIFRPMTNSLHTLRLDGNRLQHLEKNTLEDVRRTLRVLRLDRNLFSDLSNALTDIKQLEQLESLNISRNDISWFDYALLPLNLKTLIARSNKIEVLGNYYELETQMRLEELDVSDNSIRQISAASLPNSIRKLSLRNNRIEKVDQFAFVAKHNVTFVDLRNNSLSRLDNNAFRLGVQRPTSSYFFTSREEVHSSLHASAAYLPPPVFLIAYNPFYCDCTMEWLQRVNQLVGGVSGSGAISTYPRIADLDEVSCELAFNRQASTVTSGVDKAVLSPLMQANSSDFLCRYRTHCFALCHCCEFDACDCEMMCPENCTCYYDQTWNTNIVDCSAAHYKAVPSRIPMDVTSLYLDGNTLQSLNAHTFIGRKNLRVLHLNHSLVQSIANRSFNGLVYLEELHLEHNRLTTLHGFEFEALHYLTSLHLQHNLIQFVHEKSFASLRSLQVLRLDHNRLTVFGAWFSVAGLLAATAGSPNVAMQRHLQISLGNNPWSCECASLTTMASTLRTLMDQLHVTDYLDVRCMEAGANKQLLLRELKQVQPSILERCNLTSALLLPFEPPKMQETSNNNVLITSEATTWPNKVHIVPNYPKTDINEEDGADNGNNPGPEVFSRPGVDQPTLVPPSINYPSIDDPGMISTKYANKIRNRGDYGSTNNNQINEDISFQPFDLFDKNRQEAPSQAWSSSWIVGSAVLGTLTLFLAAALLAIRHRKQDIQLWFYRRYGVRLFERGFCAACWPARSPHTATHRSQRGSGLAGTSFVKDSEKLFDSFVIYAQQDESFVTQQLAAELECGYPPYRLCLRYRDLPAPSVLQCSSARLASLPMVSQLDGKETGFAFDAVTQAIECSRRTLVVISENFFHSEWCRFEMKAAHQETLSSCKSHRLIVVVVPSLPQSPPPPPPSSSSQAVQQYQQQLSKAAERLLARLDCETRACMRGVTLLTWGERRFWEKLRFSMPASSSAAANGGDATTIGGGGGGKSYRTTSGAPGAAIMVTTSITASGNGYPSLKATTNSGGSSSSLARSSVLYDPLYFHHYQYAQLPVGQGSAMASSVSNCASLHKSSSTCIFRNAATMNNNGQRSAFSAKPLPPPPNQPLPPLPLVSSHHFGNEFDHQQSQAQHHHQTSTDQMLPTYASCSEYADYETTGDSLSMIMMANSNHNAANGQATLHATRMSATRTMIHPAAQAERHAPFSSGALQHQVSIHSTPRR